MSRQTDWQRMDLTAKVAFAHVYPAIAEHIVNRYGIRKGRCLDAGSGPGSLAIALARITDLQIVSLDHDSEMTAAAQRNISAAGLDSQIKTVTADVHKIPFEDRYFDLIVSRGSVFFWENRHTALRELYRVLGDPGVIYCGGGMGSEEIRREATRIIMTDDRFEDMREFWKARNHKSREEDEITFGRDIAEAGLNGAVLRECSGIWIEIIKRHH